jgi:hypothetical protein
MPKFGQFVNDDLLERKSAVIRADGDVHGYSEMRIS